MKKRIVASLFLFLVVNQKVDLQALGYGSRMNSIAQKVFTTVRRSFSVDSKQFLTPQVPQRLDEHWRLARQEYGVLYGIHQCFLLRTEQKESAFTPLLEHVETGLTLK